MTIAPTEQRILANGLHHHVLLWEAGPSTHTVVLCHGFLDLGWSWHGVAQSLAAFGFRVVAFDWRGHGETDWVGSGGYYHFPDYLLDLHELLPRIALGPVHLVGHSMGGTACAFYAGATAAHASAGNAPRTPDAQEAHPPITLASLSLIEGIGPPEHSAEHAPDRAVAFLRTVEKVRRAKPRTMASIDDAIARMRIQNPDLPPELGRFLAEKSTRARPSGAGFSWSFDPLHQTTSPMAFDLEVFLAFLKRITIPVLIVRGSKGFRVPDEDSRVAALADHRTVELEGQGHMIHWFGAEVLSDVLAGFFASL